MSKPKKKPFKYRFKQQRALDRHAVLISLEAGAAKQKMTAMEALNWAEDQSFRLRQHGLTAHVCEQLINEHQIVLEPFLIMLRVAHRMRKPFQAWQIVQRINTALVYDPVDAYFVGETYRMCEQHDRALEFLQPFVKKHPTDPRVREQMGILASELNRREEAAGHYRAQAKLSPGTYGGQRQLAQMGMLTDQEIERLRKARGLMDDADACAGMAAIERRLGNVEEEFRYLNRAQEIMRETWTWSPDKDDERADFIIENFNADYFGERQRTAVSERRPIFIVGMPRSGSTLLEQMLGARPDMVPIGESMAISAEIVELGRERYGHMEYPDLGMEIDANGITTIAERYFRDVSALYTDAPVFVDKQLESYNVIPLLYLAFPTAKFICVRRNPLDCLLSCYQQVFPLVDYSHSLEHLAVKYKNHLRLMAHFSEVLPGLVLTVNYEDLVEDPEGKTREISDYCEMDWAAEMLDFQDSSRPVRTASVMQVRRGIYRDSLEKWRRYDTFLEPARTVLMAAGVDLPH